MLGRNAPDSSFFLLYSLILECLKMAGSRRFLGCVHTAGTVDRAGLNLSQHVLTRIVNTYFQKLLAVVKLSKSHRTWNL